MIDANYFQRTQQSRCLPPVAWGQTEIQFPKRYVFKNGGSQPSFVVVPPDVISLQLCTPEVEMHRAHVEERFTTDRETSSQLEPSGTT
jgi:hypothetical protein